MIESSGAELKELCFMQNIKKEKLESRQQEK
jgi:hypothetical protein